MNQVRITTNVSSYKQNRMMSKVKNALFSFKWCFSALLFLAVSVKGQDVKQTKIEVKEVAEQKAIVLKAEVLSSEISKKMGEMFGQLYGFLGANSTAPAGAPFAIYYKYDPKGKTTFELCVPVSAKLDGNADITYKEFPKMKVVATLYVGAYEKVGPTYEALQKYITDNKLKTKGNSWEVYITDPHQEKDPSKYQTLIYFPIE